MSALADAARECQRCFVCYEALAQQRLAAELESLQGLLGVLPELQERFDVQRNAAATNGAFLRGLFDSLGMPKVETNSADFDAASAIAWVNGTLTQLKREWTEAGLEERQHTFGPVIDALERLLPVSDTAAPPRVLVPGAGLSRLPWELSLRGYDAMGVERAMSMLLVGRYIFEVLLPTTTTAAFCPFAHECTGPCNVRRAQHLSRVLEAPGADAAAASAAASTVSAVRPARTIAGDFNVFATIPESRGTWDAVASVFYVDACGDIIGAANAAHAALKPSGLWLCCGPLEYDGSFNAHASAVRLCGDELLLLVQRIGFEILEQRDVPCEYTADAESMLRMRFECLFFVARKKVVAVEVGEEAVAAPAAAAIT